SVQSLEICDDGGARFSLCLAVRWREPSLIRREPAVVVAGCFMLRTLPRAEEASVVESARAALRLDVAAALFAFEPALFRSQRRPGGTPRNRTRHRLAQQFDQAVDGHALAGEPGEPRRGIRRQRDPAGVEAQLRGGRELVDVLAAGPGGAH